MKAYGGVDVYIQVFLTSALAGGEWSVSSPGRFTPGERAHVIHSIGGWVTPRAGLEYVEKTKFLALPGLELRPLGRPARSQSLYRLSYLGSYYLIISALNKHAEHYFLLLIRYFYVFDKTVTVRHRRALHQLQAFFIPTNSA
jgi:hypothetical protein